MNNFYPKLCCLTLFIAVCLTQVQCKTVEVKVKPGQCPPMYEDQNVCSSYCINDEGCTGSAKCCSNGCALYCREPIQSEGCPSVEETCGVGNITSDLECELGLKFDDNGCFLCECDAGFHTEGVFVMVFLMNIATYLLTRRG